MPEGLSQGHAGPVTGSGGRRGGSALLAHDEQLGALELLVGLLLQEEAQPAGNDGAAHAGDDREDEDEEDDHDRGAHRDSLPAAVTAGQDRRQSPTYA